MTTLNHPDPPIHKTLLQKTKKALYGFAQAIGLSGRSSMSKSELVQSLQQRENEVKPLLQKKQSTSTVSYPAVDEAKQQIIQASRLESAQPIPASVNEPAEKHAASSLLEEPAPPAAEPVDIWHGETGPEMPRHYGRTMLFAMPRDPNWVYLYWEIADEKKREVQQQRGGWVFETSTSVLRVYDTNGNVYQEIPVLLDSMSWYLSLPSSRDFEFEIGIKAGEEFIPLAKSNRISLTSAEPSPVTDDEWAVVEERFHEMLESAAAGPAGSLGSSEKVLPHLVSQRFRIPWDTPSLHDLPSSHSVSSHSMSSSHLQQRKS